jgi:hypothetical protein
MGLFGKLLKTAIDVATTPIDVVKDVVTLGGAITNEESALAKKARMLGEDLEDIRDEADKL